MGVGEKGFQGWEKGSWFSAMPESSSQKYANFP